MKKLLILSLLSLICFGISIKNKVHNKHRSKNRFRHRKFRSIEPKTISVTPEEDQKQQEANKKAEEIFAKSPKGRDDEDPVFYSDNLTFKFMPPELSLKASAIDTQARNRDIIITKCTIAIMNQLNYRGVDFGINLLELAGRDLSSVSAGKCCEGLGDTYTQKIEKYGGAIETSYCFRISGYYDTWLLCSPIPTKIYEFRMKLMTAVIKAVLRHQGIYNVNVLLPNDGVEDWTWHSQNDWKGVCRSGSNQSPIDIDAGRAESVSYMSVRFKFKDADDAVVKYNGRENEVYGDFGRFIHKLEIGTRNFMTYKISFKFPSEHRILGVEHEGEMQVYSVSSDGSTAVFSFFIDQDFESKATWNTFIDSLKTEKWGFKEDVEAQIGKKSLKLKSSGNEDGEKKFDNPNLDSLIINTNDKGIQYFFKDIYRRSFFWYTGSLTTPPCKEGVWHFVFEMPIFIPAQQFIDLKEKTFSQDMHIKGNSRKPFPQGNRKVYQHTDYGKKCADIPDVPFDDDKFNQEKQEAKIHTLDLTGVKASYIKASSIATTYGYTGMDLPSLDTIKGETSSGRQTIDLSQVKPEEVPFNIKTKLLKRKNEIIKKLNDKDEKTEDLLDERESIKIPYFD